MKNCSCIQNKLRVSPEISYPMPTHIILSVVLFDTCDASEEIFFSIKKTGKKRHN